MMRRLLCILSGHPRSFLTSPDLYCRRCGADDARLVALWLRPWRWLFDRDLGLISARFRKCADCGRRFRRCREDVEHVPF